MDALGEALRVLQPGGRLLIEEPDTRQVAGKVVALAERFLLMHSRFLSVEDLTAWIARQGLRFVVDRDRRISVRIAVDK
jgi:demethylmenaquinone methyltransferase/2-methoxy-6-polyprenyl-1,4-benzoquinol methylase